MLLKIKTFHELCLKTLLQKHLPVLQTVNTSMMWKQYFVPCDVYHIYPSCTSLNDFLDTSKATLTGRKDELVGKKWKLIDLQACTLLKHCHSVSGLMCHEGHRDKVFSSLFLCVLHDNFLCVRGQTSFLLFILDLFNKTICLTFQEAFYSSQICSYGLFLKHVLCLQQYPSYFLKMFKEAGTHCACKHFFLWKHGGRHNVCHMHSVIVVCAAFDEHQI